MFNFNKESPLPSARPSPELESKPKEQESGLFSQPNPYAQVSELFKAKVSESPWSQPSESLWSKASESPWSKPSEGPWSKPRESLWSKPSEGPWSKARELLKVKKASESNPDAQANEPSSTTNKFSPYVFGQMDNPFKAGPKESNPDAQASEPSQSNAESNNILVAKTQRSYRTSDLVNPKDLTLDPLTLKYGYIEDGKFCEVDLTKYLQEIASDVEVNLCTLKSEFRDIKGRCYDFNLYADQFSSLILSEATNLISRETEKLLRLTSKT